MTIPIPRVGAGGANVIGGVPPHPWYISNMGQNEKCDLAHVLSFVDRTVSKGVPVRVAIARASKRFRMDRNLIRGFYRAPFEGE